MCLWNKLVTNRTQMGNRQKLYKEIWQIIKNCEVCGCLLDVKIINKTILAITDAC